jgi:hypothetical protein
VPGPRVSAQTHRCPKFGPRMGVSSPGHVWVGPLNAVFSVCLSGWTETNPRCPFGSARRCPYDKAQYSNATNGASGHAWASVGIGEASVALQCYVDPSIDRDVWSSSLLLVCVGAESKAGARLGLASWLFYFHLGSYSTRCVWAVE